MPIGTRRKARSPRGAHSRSRSRRATSSMPSIAANSTGPDRGASARDSADSRSGASIRARPSANGMPASSTVPCASTGSSVRRSSMATSVPSTVILTLTWPGSCTRCSSRCSTVTPISRRPTASSGRGRSTASSPCPSVTTSSREFMDSASRLARPRRTSAAYEARRRSSAPICRASCGADGAMRRAATGPSNCSVSSRCGSHLAHSQSAMRSPGAATAMATSSGACRAAVWTSRARATRRQSSRGPITLTLPIRSSGTVSGSSVPLRNRFTSADASLSMNRSGGVSTVEPGSAIPRSRTGISPVPTRTRRKSSSTLRRSQRRAGSRTMSYRAYGGGFRTSARSRRSRSSPDNSSRRSST